TTAIFSAPASAASATRRAATTNPVSSIAMREDRTGLVEDRHAGDEAALQGAVGARRGLVVDELVVGLQDHPRQDAPGEGHELAVLVGPAARLDVLEAEDAVQRAVEREDVLDVEAQLAGGVRLPQVGVRELAGQLVAPHGQVEVRPVGVL